MIIYSSTFKILAINQVAFQKTEYLTVEREREACTGNRCEFVLAIFLNSPIATIDDTWVENVDGNVALTASVDRHGGLGEGERYLPGHNRGFDVDRCA